MAVRARALAAEALALAVVLAIDAAAAAPTRAQDPPDPPRIRSVRVEPGDVFTEADERGFVFWRLANAIHIETREEIIRRELLFEPGSIYRPEVLAESERNLRDLRFISRATVEAIPREDGDVDVLVRTRDKFSLAVGAGVSLAGGVAKGNVQVSESNLLGYGKLIRFNFTQSTNRTIFRAGYQDPNVFGTRHTLDALLSVSDLGTFATVTFGRPFYSLETPLAYGIRATREVSTVEYFDEGDVVAEIDQEVREVEAAVAFGFGTRTTVRRVELTLRADNRTYDPPEGDDPLRIRWPRDRDAQTLTVRPSIQWLERFDEVFDLDAYDLTEDVKVGAEASAVAGVQRRQDSEGVRAEAVFGGTFQWVARPSGEDFLAVRLEALYRHDGDRPQAYELDGFARYYRRFRGHTLAVSFAGRAIEELEDLEPQLTLGEDNGLRGFDARVFAGTRLLRLNVEDRIFTPFELFNFHLGLVGFFDAGVAWYPEDPPDLDDIEASVGIGFRVFCPELLKRTPVRIDIAFPLTDGADRSISISVGSGQVFSLLSGETDFEPRF